MKKALDLADIIVPIIDEQINKEIQWQIDYHKIAEKLKGNDYYQFVNEIRKEILKQL